MMLRIVSATALPSLYIGTITVTWGSIAAAGVSNFFRRTRCRKFPRMYRLKKTRNTNKDAVSTSKELLRPILIANETAVCGMGEKLEIKARIVGAQSYRAIKMLSVIGDFSFPDQGA